MEKLGKKLKHDHTLTSILKFTIFAMVMLAPIFSVASRCLYVICNKNAYQSYSDESVQKVDQISNSGTLTNGLEYMFKYNESLNTNALKIQYSDINVDWYDYGANTSYTYNTFAIQNLGTTHNPIIYLYDDYTHAPTVTLTNVWGNTLKSFTFTATGRNYTLNGNDNYLIYYTTYTHNKLDNAFEYSLSQLQESSYYNWATNLGIYTPIQNMVSGLGGHSIISLLLAYWSIYTAIYIVFDIIIVCFVKITHMIQGE